MLADLKWPHTVQRDPALWASLGGTAVRLFAAFILPLTIDQQSLLNAAIAATVGVGVAFAVKDGAPAAILGAVQALIALSVGLGLGLGPENQALIMSFVSTVIAMFVRTQVIASAPPK